MYKSGMKWNLLGVLISFGLLCIFCSNCTEQTLNSQQIARIEQLSRLKPYDMVLHKNGFIYMVERLDHQDREKPNWELTLRRNYNAPTDYQTWYLMTWGDSIQRIIYQDDPLWKQAALCYLKDENCKFLNH